jgi:hypothetical protein
LDDGRSATSGYLNAFSPELLLDACHLVFEPQLKFLEADFLYLFIFTQIMFIGERFQALGVLGMFLSQPTKFFVAGKKLFTNGSYHPEEPPANVL